MAVKVDIDLPLVAKDYSGSTSATPNAITQVSFAETKWIYIENTDPALPMLVSWDNEATWDTLAAGEFRDFDIARTSVRVKAATASVPYKLMVGV